MDLMPIQSVSTEPAPPTEDVESADLTGFGEMIASLLTESNVGSAGEISFGPQSGIDPDTGERASDPASSDPGKTGAPPAEDGPPAPPQPASLAMAGGPDESPNTVAKTTEVASRPDMTRQPDASGPVGDMAASSTTATDQAGHGKPAGPVPSITEPDPSDSGLDPGISFPASTRIQPAKARGDGSPVPIEAANAAKEPMPAQSRRPTASPSGPTVTSPGAATTSPTADSAAPVATQVINTERGLTPNSATGAEPAAEGHEPEPASPIPKTDAERPTPAPKPPVDMQIPETAGEVPARAPEAQVEVERAAMAEVIDRLREWADRVKNARQPDSISLKLAEPDGDVLIKLAMRDGRLELNVTRPGGEAPSWLTDQLDDALARHGFDLSGGDPETGHTDARWDGGNHKPDRRSGSQARSHQPDQSEGLWI